MDYYSILGVSKNATTQEIKKAYRKLAMQHHPDRGGDEKIFRQVSDAYDILSDPQKKQRYDLGGDPYGNSNRGPRFDFNFGGVPPGFEDVFGFNFNNRQRQKNQSVNLNLELTLEESVLGKNFDAEINLPSGSTKIVSISVPPGINHGQQIRYSGMGENNIPNIPPGDLIINIFLKPNRTFVREGDNLIVRQTITVWDAILGTKLNIPTIDGRTLSINVPAGTQPDTTLSCRDEGVPNVKTGRKGSLLVKIGIKIPKIKNDKILEQIKSFKNS